MDAVWPFGAGHLLPRGLLREPLPELARAGFLVVTRSGLVGLERRQAIKDRLGKLAKGVPTALCDTMIEGLRPLNEQTPAPIEATRLRQGRWAAFCGIGNPAGFQYTLQSCGYRVAEFREFPDHHRYTRSDVESLAAWADRLEVAAVLCTHKDLVKLAVDQLGRRPLRAVRVGLEILAGRDELETKLRAVLPRPC